MDDQRDAEGTAPAPELSIEGPLSRDDARALLERAGDLLDQGEFADAARHYQRVVGFDDAAVTGAALLGLGEALYRLDQEPAAIATWESCLELPENPSTYAAWRNVAAARVREGDIQGAIVAYRQADRRAPAEDKAEIANRLGWLAKESGDNRRARRYFAAGRAAGPALPLTWLIIGLTVVVSVGTLSVPDTLFPVLELDKAAVANGEYYRLWSVTLVHANFLHLFFNMYALYLVGPLVEMLYGSWLYLAFYLILAAAGSIGSFVFFPHTAAVGASGAIFGLFGVLAAASRTHNPVLDRRGRALVGQIGMLIVLNLIIGFTIPGIDNAAHIGGLLAGLWLGFLIVPGRVATLGSLWQRPGGPTPQPGQSMVLPALGVVALVIVLIVGLAIGTDAQRSSGAGSQPASVVTVVVSARDAPPGVT